MEPLNKKNSSDKASIGNYLVCYDIKNKRRLCKIHKLFLSVGIPLQYSVFHLKVDENMLEKTIERINKIIESSEDDVRIYHIYKFDISIWKKTSTDKLNQALMVF